MIAITLLFLLIICLLWWLVKLIYEHFQAYHLLNHLNNDIIREAKTRLYSENAATSAQLVKEKTKVLIVDRLTYIHQELSSLPMEAGLQAEELEFLITKQRSLFHSYFNLLTIEEEE